jgi:glycerol-1-phosphate dehydrogenase [NAD(P)+]
MSSDISPLLSTLTQEAAESGDPHRTRYIFLGNKAVRRLGPWLQDNRPGMIDVLVADPQTWLHAGQTLESILRNDGRAPTKLVLEPHAGEPGLVCEDGMIDALVAFLSTSKRLNPIAVGAGTVNDIVKAASLRAGRSYQVVPTAASMNGYTSSIVAVLSGGVKRTLPSHQPEAVFADVEIIRKAPTFMNRAGFGDLLSKPYCNADWLLSHWLRDVPHSDVAAKLLDEPWHRMLNRAAGIGTGDDRAIFSLMETILISGFSMAVAGSSAPASGAEHLMSHYWDMEAHCQQQPIRALHGTQVGIGTYLSSLMFERLCRVDIDDVDFQAALERRRDASWIDNLEAEHPYLSQPVLEEIKAQIAQKQRHGDAFADELRLIKQKWPMMQNSLRDILIPSKTIVDVLNQAGCPNRASQIGVEMGHLIRTLRVCRHIRQRYVCLDLIDDLGFLDDWAYQVARESENLGQNSVPKLPNPTGE